ncbi:MAG TPA: ATP-dependent DNA helicase [Nitrososphaeraceae archaeon]|nr:ATP-dependent DNA helicase [Nitrososphaeraceae archaeon]
MSNSNNNGDNRQPLTISELIKNFPFPSKRHNQEKILSEICNAFNSGCKHVILEAPTGFGKSPVAIAVALSLGSSYICTATKDLQTQYSKDFPYLKVAKGKNNFPCLVKEDFIRNGIYKCGICASSDVNECYHTTVEYGPCMTDESFRDSGCKYKTFTKDYKIDKQGTKEEQVFIDNSTKKHYQKEYSQWLPIQTLKEQREGWKPCEYFDQLSKALAASHSIFNYSIFLSLLPRKKTLPERELLVLDEGHLLETEIVKFRGLSVSKRRWKRYIHDLMITDYGYDNVERWIDFLIELETKMLTLTGNNAMIESFSIERKVKYNHHGQEEKITSSKHRKKVVSASDLFDSDEEIAEKYDDGISKGPISKLGDELTVDAIRDIERLTRTINNILANPKNWIVSEIIKENYEVVKVELKPLDISSYCKNVFEKCSKTLIMSATILNHKAFCRSVGLSEDHVKFIQVQSDFPLENRPIIALNIAYLNYNNLQYPEVKSSIARAVDNIMSFHLKDKGIIHTTSYEQLNFIKENISQPNARRLLVTDPEIQRDEVIFQHANATKPTVLISPSLHTGLDLKNELSRFQVITKVPYPNKSDRWTNAKREVDEEWYYWQTALKLIQAYGRSVRSKDDWAKTYILDSAFGYFVKKNMNILPDWFRQAIRKG